MDINLGFCLGNSVDLSPSSSWLPSML